MPPLALRAPETCRWDCVSLGEVMLRLDPGDGRVHTTRTFQVWEGGGEYNVARGLKRCFGLNTAVVTALADNPVGTPGGRPDVPGRRRAARDLGEVRRRRPRGAQRAQLHGAWLRRARARWVARTAGTPPSSQLKPGDVDWDEIFGALGARWLHTGGIFCALSETTPLVAEEAMAAARRHGTIISYDLNYRDSLWKSIGGQAKAREVNRRLAPYIDVMLGNEEDFSAALGFEIEGVDEHLDELDPAQFKQMIETAVAAYPNFKVVATTLRNATTASVNDWGAIAWVDGAFYTAPNRDRLEIWDRVGGGDSFASGLIYGLLAGKGPQYAVECGAAHGALAMTTPGDTSMATLAEVERVMKGGLPECRDN